MRPHRAVDRSALLGTRLSRRGTLASPALLGQWLAIVPGSLVTAQLTEQGLVIRVPGERDDRVCKACFLPENATDREDSIRAAAVVRQELGLDPASRGVETPSRQGGPALTGRQRARLGCLSAGLWPPTPERTGSVLCSRAVATGAPPVHRPLGTRNRTRSPRWLRLGRSPPRRRERATHPFPRRARLPYRSIGSEVGAGQQNGSALRGAGNLRGLISERVHERVGRFLCQGPLPTREPALTGSGTRM